MSNDTQAQSPLDVLNSIQNMDLSTVETDFPILASGNVAANVSKCEWNVEDPNKPFLLVEYSLAQPWKTQTRDGIPSKAVNPGDKGSTFKQRIYIGTYEDKSGEMKKYGVEQIAQLREAVFGKAAPGATFNPSEMIGQQVVVTLKFDPAPKNKKTGETFGPRTDVFGWVRKAR